MSVQSNKSVLMPLMSNFTNFVKPEDSQPKQPLIGAQPWSFDNCGALPAAQIVTGVRQPGQRQGFGMNIPRKRKNSFQAQSPLQLLNESFTDLSSKIKFEAKVKPDKSVFYRCFVEINGQLFSGEGSNKKNAKQAMALNAVEKVIPESKRNNLQMPLAKLANITVEETQDYEPEFKLELGGPQKSALSILQNLTRKKGPEFKPNFEFLDISAPNAKPHEKRFQCTLKINDRTFIESGIPKHKLKVAAATQACVQMFGISEESITQEEKQSVVNIRPMESPIKNIHEACMKRKYEISWNIQTQDGETPKPGSKFKASITIKIEGGEEKIFEGLGNSKKSAKIIAACMACNKLFESKLDPNLHLDDLPKGNNSAAGFNIDYYTKPMVEIKNAANILHELCQKNAETKLPNFHEAKEEMNGKSKSYTMKVEFREREFLGSGISKKMAKTQCCREILSNIFGMQTPDPSSKGGNKIPMELGPKCDVTQISHGEIPAIADKVCDLVRMKYKSLCMEHNLTHTSYLSAFLISTGDDVNETTLISLATGACLKESTDLQQIAYNKTGLYILDSHSEVKKVLSRRGLLLFFYQQLSLLSNPQMANMSIFECRTNANGYKLKDNVKLHLYSTLAPNGDSRLENSSPEVGLLRTYLPGKGRTFPTKEFMSGNSLMSPESKVTAMSISDKLLKWGILGVQGSLLSKFIEPIFIQSIIIGSISNTENILRAVSERILPKSSNELKISRPLVSNVSNPEKVNQSHPPLFAMSWTLAAPAIEIIAQDLGLETNGKSSRLCKKFIFEEFAKLDGKMKTIEENKIKWSTYFEAKQTAVEYQTVKKQLYNKCEAAGLGPWLKNPKEIEEFGLPWAD